MSDLWRGTTPDPVNISDTFSQRKLTDALQHLKLGKAPGADSIYPVLKIHAGAALKSWLCDFLSSCFLFALTQKFSKSEEEHFKLQFESRYSLWGIQRVINQYLCSVSLTRSWRGLSMLV